MFLESLICKIQQMYSNSLNWFRVPSIKTSLELLWWWIAPCTDTPVTLFFIVWLHTFFKERFLTSSANSYSYHGRTRWFQTGLRKRCGASVPLASSGEPQPNAVSLIWRCLLNAGFREGKHTSPAAKNPAINGSEAAASLDGAHPERAKHGGGLETIPSRRTTQ